MSQKSLYSVYSDVPGKRYFLGAFAKLRLSVRPHGTTRLPPEGFS